MHLDSALPSLGWGASLLGVLAACSGPTSPDPGASPAVGTLTAKPEGGYFLADAHQSGQASRLNLVEIGWGRMVDVHDVDALGRPSTSPLLRDVVIGEDVLSDGQYITLEAHPVTHAWRLILHRSSADSGGAGPTFGELLAQVTRSLAPVRPKADDGSASLPVSMVSRDAVLVLRFDDLLEDGPELASALFEAVRLSTGYPPVTPALVRTQFDAVHGGIVGGAFHSTRVLIDLALGEHEASSVPYALPVSPAGLPASSPLTPQPNVSLHLVTHLDPARGRMTRLTNLAGRPLEPSGPVDAQTGDVVRAWRSGNASDVHSGFLLDLTPPSLIGSFELTLESARPATPGHAGFEFLVDLRFDGVCRLAPRRGDLLEVGGEPYEFGSDPGAPDADGRVRAATLVRLLEEPLDDPDLLLGRARLSAPYREQPALDPACWMSFLPPAREPPGAGVAAESQIVLRFSEPMDPDSFRAFDSFRVLRGAAGGPSARAHEIVVGEVKAAANLQVFRFLPRLPLDGRATRDYRVELLATLDGVRDLTGAPLTRSFEQAGFTLDPSEAPRATAGFALRFATTDELDAPGLSDVRGQVFPESGARGVLRPRPAHFGSFVADRNVPLLSVTGRFPPGVQSPLSPLGSRVQMLWRYADFDWRVRDESFHNIDVIGLHWSPASGALVSDLFPAFELRLGHSPWKPDEAELAGTPRYPDSGLPIDTRFDDNFLGGRLGGPVVVHPRHLGYRIRPADLTLSAAGTPLIAFPWNRSGAALTSYTWRDTALLARGDPGGAGVPMDVEDGPPLWLDEGIGSYYPERSVPSIGLPLLWEVRCYPSAAGLGLNALDVLLTFPGWPTPRFRLFSTGGIDTTGARVEKDPDLEHVPSGGFNPNSSPPGKPTRVVGDGSFYVGQIDTVVRLSRAVTVWIDTGMTDPRYVAPVLEPRVQPDGTAVLAEFRAARDLPLSAGNAPFDAASLDPYGDFQGEPVDFLGDGDWSPDLTAMSGARFLQVRFTFRNNIDVGLVPELDSFGVAYESGD